jgi:hypothetical protein
MMLYALCGLFKQKEMYYLSNMLLGYFVYRLWAFVSVKASLPIRCFPFANFSSVNVLFFFTLINDAPQIYQFILSVFEQSSGMSRLDLIMYNYEN